MTVMTETRVVFDKETERRDIENFKKQNGKEWRRKEDDETVTFWRRQRYHLHAEPENLIIGGAK